MEDDCSLDLSMKDPKIVIAPEGSYMEATVRSRQYATGQYFAPEKPVRIVNLYTSGAQFKDSDGKISWSDIATALTSDGVKMFSDFYNENEGLDPLNFTYKGKGVRPAGDQGDCGLQPKNGQRQGTTTTFLAHFPMVTRSWWLPPTTA